jgi:16S rRNA processing protein RimM
LKINPETRGHLILMGEITGAHGIKGALKFRSYAESPTLFASGRQLIVHPPNGVGISFTVKWVQPHRQGLRLMLNEISDRGQAESLTGAGVYIDRKILPELTDGSHYWFDLIGLAVLTVEGTFLGHLASIIQTGSNDVYVVTGNAAHDEQEILIPALETVVDRIDLDAGRMVVRLPEGLLNCD